MGDFAMRRAFGVQQAPASRQNNAFLLIVLAVPRSSSSEKSARVSLFHRTERPFRSPPASFLRPFRHGVTKTSSRNLVTKPDAVTKTPCHENPP
jgi:hypothetical protein